MKDLARLLGYARRYWPHLLASTFLMAVAGAAQGTMALLTKPIFDKVLNPSAGAGPIPLLPHPIFHRQLYLDQLVPLHNRTVWTLVGFAIVAVFLIKGICDYIGNYLISYAGYSSVTDLRNGVFDKLLRHGASFFEAHSTGQLMSSVMNDVDRVQLATSQMLADFLRQLFTALAFGFVVLTSDWRLAVVSLTVLPFVLLPTRLIGRRIRRTSRGTQDRQADLNQILQETLSGHTVVGAFQAEAYESARFREASRRLLRSNLRYTLQQALSSPLIELFGAATIVGLLTYAVTQIKTGAMTAGDF
ncbi:MAG: ABC transporter ATP-binding protein, partial [Acidobacteriia bacterium]|nr:ABC transporter ATP-binding protein [Terriglobia bacterium]